MNTVVREEKNLDTLGKQWYARFTAICATFIASSIRRSTNETTDYVSFAFITFNYAQLATKRSVQRVQPQRTTIHIMARMFTVADVSYDHD